jgi:3-oxoadipate enol-lactonase
VPSLNGKLKILNYQIDGDRNLPTLILSPSLGSTLEMWEPNLESLLKDFAVLRHDHLGHGKSSAPDHPYTLEEVGREVLAITRKEEISQFYFAGISLGGLLGMWLGINAPEKVRGLALFCTNSCFAPPQRWKERANLARNEGLTGISEASLERWFTPAYLAQNVSQTEKIKAMIKSNSAIGYANNCALLEQADLTNQLSQIRCETLVVAGHSDPTLEVAQVEELAALIPNSTFKVIEGASHLATFEQPEITCAMISEQFLGRK